MPFQEQCFDFDKLDHSQIQAILQENNLALTIDETLTIQKMLDRPVTLTECILWSIQGSEHCSYKSTRTHLKKLPTDGPNVILGAKEDAGVVRIATDKKGKHYGIVISHESHNHPSQIVPYEGAATGVGGNVRDVSCMGAQVIAVADSLRFGNIDNNQTRRIHHGVIDGIAAYGNALGIPNIGGDLYYDDAYQENCLVTVVTLGIVEEENIVHSYAPKNADGYDLILVGKPTDNSGFGGASFASLELDTEQHEQNRGAVQEPNAFLGRHLLASNAALFELLKEKDLIDQVGFKDLGAGGVACAGVELADTAGYGAEIYLDQVHTAEDNIHPAVILCSETQERYMWVTPTDITPLILKHYNETYDLPKVSQGAKASVVGKIRDNAQFVVHFGDEKLVDAKAQDITKGLVYDRPYSAKEKNLAEPHLAKQDLEKTLLNILAHENIASRKTVFENYDKQVQGRTHIDAGTADAGVMQPFNSNEFPEEIRQIGIALSLDHNPRYGKIDAYWAAINAVVESMRNVAAVGAVPQTITDCLCFGNPEKPEQMNDLVQSIEGIKDALEGIPLKPSSYIPKAFQAETRRTRSRAAECTVQSLSSETSAQQSLGLKGEGYATPVIAGNVSLYNESKNQVIPASPMISCLGKLDDVNRALTYSFKKTNSHLLMIGERKDECGGSVYYALHNELGKNMPKPDLKEVAHQIYAITDMAEQNLLLSAHDIADGGIAVCLAEMSFDNEIGFNVEIPGELSLDKKLFSETGGFVVEVAEAHLAAVEKLLSDYKLASHVIGKTQAEKTLQFNNQINLDLNNAKQLWQNSLYERLQ